jgi:hypothetical protein
LPLARALLLHGLTGQLLAGRLRGKVALEAALSGTNTNLLTELA